MPRVEAAKKLNDEDRSVLYEGANKSQLAVLFKCDDDTLTRKMRGVHPVGKRNNALIYSVAEVAQKMVKPSAEQIDEALRRMNPADLPKMLTKEYWAGMRARQDYEFRNGDLWPTQKVIAEVGEMVKSLKMELDLLQDGVERQTELTEPQRKLIIMMVDGAKTNMLRRLTERFAVKPVPVAAPVVEDDDEL